MIHTWRSNDYWRPRGLLSQIYGGTQIYGAKRIWGRSQVLLEYLRIPEPIKRAGITQREIGVLLLTPYVPMDVSFTWTIEAQVFDPGVPQPQDDVDSFRRQFNVTDTSDGVIEIEHNLNNTPTSVTITDGDGEWIEPDGIRIVDDNHIEVDLTSYGEFDGDWSINLEG